MYSYVDKIKKIALDIDIVYATIIGCSGIKINLDNVSLKSDDLTLIYSIL